MQPSAEVVSSRSCPSRDREAESCSLDGFVSDSKPLEYNIDTSFNDTSTSAPATSESTSSNDNFAPAIDQLVRENETLKEAVLEANRRLTRLEDERWLFFNEGIFDLVNSVCAREKNHVNPTCALASTNKVGGLLVADMLPPSLESVRNALDDNVVACKQEQSWSSECFADHIPMEIADSDKVQKLACTGQRHNGDATCPTDSDEPKDLDPKWLSLDMPYVQPYCVDACGTLLKGDTKRSYKEDGE